VGDFRTLSLQRFQRFDQLIAFDAGVCGDEQYLFTCQLITHGGLSVLLIKVMEMVRSVFFPDA
jgi:hypothetical protein